MFSWFFFIRTNSSIVFSYWKFNRGSTVVFIISHHRLYWEWWTFIELEKKLIWSSGTRSVRNQWSYLPGWKLELMQSKSKQIYTFYRQSNSKGFNRILKLKNTFPFCAYSALSTFSVQDRKYWHLYFIRKTASWCTICDRKEQKKKRKPT